MPRKLFVCCVSLALGLCSLPLLSQQASQPKLHLNLRNAPPMRHGLDSAAIENGLQASSTVSAPNQLPIWNYQVLSTRDGNIYGGNMVGANPATRGTAASVSVPGQIVPVILKFHTIGVSFNPTTGKIRTRPGDTTFDPTVPDNACLTAPNNMPIDLLRKSPVFSNAKFNFGGTDVGDTQYTDAFQRASFWRMIDRANYHVRMAPIRIMAPLVVDVPAKAGLALSGAIFGACSSLGIVDINLIDQLVVEATLTTPGINPKTFPMFMLYNSGMSFGDPTNLGNCCAGGYHGINPVTSIAFQTYSPFDFQTNGIFLNADDTVILSHEAAEWMDDPYDFNPTPAWGHTGQVNFCQNNLEVGDPLTGTNISPIVGKNGFTYHLQELAFFSWFFGSPSIGLHGWFSDNGTFMTDAGPPCH